MCSGGPYQNIEYIQTSILAYTQALLSTERIHRFYRNSSNLEGYRFVTINLNCNSIWMYLAFFVKFCSNWHYLFNIGPYNKRGKAPYIHLIMLTHVAIGTLLQWNQLSRGSDWLIAENILTHGNESDRSKITNTWQCCQNSAKMAIFV